MATYLRLYPKPYIQVPEDVANYVAFHVDPGMTTRDVEALVSNAEADEQIVLPVVLSDLMFPVSFGFRKCDWSAWMVHPLDDYESEVEAHSQHGGNSEHDQS
ncbi:hypothetical protein ACUXOC_000231 [Corynebacterium mucifaciens]